MNSVHTKVKCLFSRTDEGVLVTDHLNPLINLEGSMATVKHHGQCSYIGYLSDEAGVNCQLWRRYDRKPDKKKAARGVPLQDLREKHFKQPPAGWRSMMDHWDPKTGHWPGWKPLSSSDPDDKWYFHQDTGAVRTSEDGKIQVRILSPDLDPDSATGYQMDWIDLTCLTPHSYEFVGPKIQGNRYGLAVHCFIKHGAFLVDLSGVDISYKGLRSFLREKAWEGLVWHGPHGLVKVHCGHLDINDHWKSIRASVN